MQVVSSKPLNLSQVAELLNKRKSEGTGELEYEQGNTLAYAEAFGTMSGKDVESLGKELNEVTAIPREQVLQIADLQPKNEDELAQILSAGKMELPKEQLKELVKVLKKYKKG